MRNHHTEVITSKTKQHRSTSLYVVDDDAAYAIPKSVAKKYIIQKTKLARFKDTMPAEQVFTNLERKLTKAGALLKGTRIRERLSQVEFAKKINVTQANLSKMENGKRPIGKNIAKRIERVFDVDYRYFLE